MRSQSSKDWIHWILRGVLAVNAWIIRYFRKSKLISRRTDGRCWVHLGCGDKYLDGMINIDVNPGRKVDLLLDLRGRMPFEDRSVDAIYCCHTLEHFYEWDVRRILSEGLRIIKPGGGIRILTPDLNKSFQAYLRKDHQYFSDFPDRRRSIGGRLVNYLMCRDQHRLLFDFTFWEEILQDVGFDWIQEMKPHQSRLYPELEIKKFEYETPDRHYSIIVEAGKNER